MSTINRVRELILSGAEPSDFEKASIAEQIEKGYVSRKNGVLSLNIPYLDAGQAKTAREILKKHADNILNRDEIGKVFIGYCEHIKKFLPSFISEVERRHYLTGYDPYNAIFWLLMEKGYLKKPNEYESKYVCTLMCDF